MTKHARRLGVLLIAALLMAQDAAPPVMPPVTTPTLQPSATKTIAAGADIAVIRIEGDIYGHTLDSLKRRAERAVAAGATMIVIELDTPGGFVDTALKIARYIKADIPVPTVAWVHNQAYSAGILIASSCNQLIMSPSSVTGDCAPIVPGQNAAPTERAKMLSPILEEFRDSARANGYDYAMFHAMCVLGVQVYEVQHKTTGETRLVNQADYAVLVEGEEIDAANKAHTGSVSTTQPSTLGVSVEVAQHESDRGQWKKIRMVHDGKTLLTLNQTRAEEVGLSKASDVRNFADLKQHFAANSVTEIPPTWSESVAGWLTSPMVRAGLVIVMLLAGYMEMQAPGLGLPGAVAVITLLVLLGSPFIIGLSEIWHIILFFVGFLLLMVEILVLPGFGVFGILGIIFMLTGLMLGVVPTSGSGPINLPTRVVMGRFWESFTWTMVSMVGTMIGMYYMLAYFEHIPGLSRMILQNPEQQPPSDMPGAAMVGVGAVGRVTTGLRPSGRVEIDGQLVDVVALGGWVEAGTQVKVVEVSGNRVVVDKV